MTIAGPTKLGVRFTDRGPPRASNKRPAAPQQPGSSTGLREGWGLLFDENGHATYENGRFLMALAKHIIDDFAPGSSSLVVTPEKLGVLYSRYRLDSEVHPFMEIFTSRAKNAHDRLADFFTDLGCQHHLVQPDPFSRPSVPALTPLGFAQYLTTCILAYPDEEFHRLEKIVADIQIVADTPPVKDEFEKFPRQLFRSQFPVRHDAKSRNTLAAALDGLIRTLRTPEPSSPKHPLATTLAPLSSPGEGDVVPLVHRYVPTERINARGDKYLLPPNSEASKARERPSPHTRLPQDALGEQSILVPEVNSPGQSHRREKMRTRYENECGTSRPSAPDACGGVSVDVRGHSKPAEYSPSSTAPAAAAGRRGYDVVGDGGPTWEEVLRSGSSYQHRRAGSSSSSGSKVIAGKGGGGGSRDRRHRSSH